MAEVIRPWPSKKIMRLQAVEKQWKFRLCSSSAAAVSESTVYPNTAIDQVQLSWNHDCSTDLANAATSNVAVDIGGLFGSCS